MTDPNVLNKAKRPITQNFVKRMLDAENEGRSYYLIYRRLYCPEHTLEKYNEFLMNARMIDENQKKLFASAPVLGKQISDYDLPDFDWVRIKEAVRAGEDGYEVYKRIRLAQPNTMYSREEFTTRIKMELDQDEEQKSQSLTLG